jgi:two-component system sensor histidine kinase KdpD
MLIMYFVIALVNAALTYKIRLSEKNRLIDESRAKTIKLYNTILNSLSHELRTPIATIIGASDNLLLNPEKLDRNTQAELMQEISKASMHLNYQVENLLNMSRIESGIIRLHKNWCDINDLIHSTVNKLETELKDHKVIVEVPDKFPLCKVDFVLLERALFNLLLNAGLYTPKGSVVTVTATRSEEIMNDTLEQLSDELIIKISDNGNGFPQEDVNRVFEKFFRLENSTDSGTGLGLSIARGFVEAHQGNISLRNLPDGGAEFTIVIPSEMSFIANLKNE